MKRKNASVELLLQVNLPRTAQTEKNVALETSNVKSLMSATYVQ